MKIKIIRELNTKVHPIGTVLNVFMYDIKSIGRYRPENSAYWIHKNYAVITELPESFCVQKCDDKEKWAKYVDWLTKGKRGLSTNYNSDYAGINDGIKTFGCARFGTEIDIDDMIKHIEYMENIDKYVDADGKPFIVGAWYKLTDCDDAYRKCASIPIEDKLTYLESINGRTYIERNLPTNCIDLSRMKRVDDSEVEKHILKEEFDMTTNEGRLAYAKKNYPIGTKIVSVYGTEGTIESVPYGGPRYGGWGDIFCGDGRYILYEGCSGRWAKIIKEEVKEEKMEIQKLSRRGLKEIHSVACSGWKSTLETYGTRNPLEDYVELTQGEVNEMFNACTTEQLPIVSKYLKQDDNSVIITDCKTYNPDILEVRTHGEYKGKGFYLNSIYNWEIKKDENGVLCLVPTKKK